MNNHKKISAHRRNLWITTLILSLTSLVSLQAQDLKGLDIDLISENTSIAPGETFTVGIQLRHHKGYHTYWKSPGIVGLPTSIEWKLPEGFKAGKIQWPYPQISSMAGHPCHGYERDVLLLVEITPPAQIPQKKVTLTASTRWMCCARDCHPGFKDFTITLPVDAKSIANTQTQPLFVKARKEIPKPNKQWKSQLLSQPDAAIIKLSITPPKGASAPDYLFSEDGQISSNKKQTFVKQPDGSYHLSIDRCEFSPKGKKHLPCIVQAGKTHIAINTSYPNP